MGKLSESARAKLLKYPPEFYVDVCNKFTQGMSAREIAAALGITRNAVIGIIKRARDQGQSVERNHIPKKYVKPSGRVVASKRKSESKLQIVKPVPVVHEEPGDTITLQDLKPHHCRWVRNDNYFCGKPRSGHSWWCHEHHQIVYRPGTEFNRKRSRFT